MFFNLFYYHWFPTCNANGSNFSNARMLTSMKYPQCANLSVCQKKHTKKSYQWNERAPTKNSQLSQTFIGWHLLPSISEPWLKQGRNSTSRPSRKCEYKPQLLIDQILTVVQVNKHEKISRFFGGGKINTHRTEVKILSRGKKGHIAKMMKIDKIRVLLRVNKTPLECKHFLSPSYDAFSSFLEALSFNNFKDFFVARRSGNFMLLISRWFSCSDESVLPSYALPWTCVGAADARLCLIFGWIAAVATMPDVLNFWSFGAATAASVLVTGCCRNGLRIFALELFVFLAKCEIISAVSTILWNVDLQKCVKCESVN